MNNRLSSGADVETAGEPEQLLGPVGCGPDGASSRLACIGCPVSNIGIPIKAGEFYPKKNLREVPNFEADKRQQ